MQAFKRCIGVLNLPGEVEKGRASAFTRERNCNDYALLEVSASLLSTRYS